MISYKHNRFPATIIAHAVGLYCRFNMSFHEAEELLLERGIAAAALSHSTTLVTIDRASAV